MAARWRRSTNSKEEVMETVKTGCAWIATLIGILFVVSVVALYLGWLRLPLMNIQREVTTHSQQYVQTHQTMMLDYYADYKRGDAAHKEAATLEICAQAALLDAPEWPSQVVPFIAENCR